MIPRNGDIDTPNMIAMVPGQSLSAGASSIAAMTENVIKTPTRKSPWLTLIASSSVVADSDIGYRLIGMN